MSVDIANGAGFWGDYPDAPGRLLEYGEFDYLTLEYLAEVFFGDLVAGEVRRYPMPNVRAFNFVCERGLDGGGQTSLRYDTQGKTYAAALLTMTLPPLTGADRQ